MLDEIRYTGYTASPSDYECPDGDLATILGLAPEEGSLKPILPPDVLFTLDAGNMVRFIHKSNTFLPDRHYIIADRAGNISWTTDGTTLHPLHSFGSHPVIDINAVGNTLIILSDDGTHYFLWKDASYLYLSTHMPECPISFGLQGTMLSSEPFDIDFADEIPASKRGDELSDNNKTSITNQTLAKVNKFIADNSTNAGKFLFPFFVRYAYRLYDGSLTMHSAPVLMITDSDLTPHVRTPIFAPAGLLTCSVTAVLHDLDYAASVQAVENLQQWDDIIKSIDIFISKPIYRYNQAGKMTHLYPSDEEDEVSYTVCRNTADAGAASLRYQKTPISEMYETTFGSKFLGGLALPRRDDDAVNGDITDASGFYLLKSISIADLKTSRTIIPVGKEYLQSLVNREAMTDDYDSHDLLIPGRAYAYNSRINLTGITKSLFQGYDTQSAFIFTDGSLHPSYGDDAAIVDGTQRVSVIVCIKQDGKDIVVHPDDNASFSIVAPFLYYYYPNPNAYKAILCKYGDGGSVRYYELPLQPHPMLNGAYFFDGWQGRPQEIPSAPSPTADRTVYLPNKIYTSEVNNPFLFPVLGINTVGTGNILGISTAAKALSQGQFGQFPLYAFTDEGVWALQINDQGGYKAIQPITRDVCINPDSITQLDSAVLFATARGIMLLSGSNSVCITDSLREDSIFSPSVLQDGDKLLQLAGLSAGDLDIIPFRTFLQRCGMIYAYIPQRVIVYNPDYPYAYIYSLNTKTWGMMLSGGIQSAVPSYPEALAMHADGSLADYSIQPDSGTQLQGIKGMLITRPLKLGQPDTLKTVDAVIQRGTFRTGSIKSILYGSRDLYNWFLVWSSADHYLRGFRGTPYKYFRIALICDMSPDESLYGATIQFTPRLTNQPR